MASETTSSAHKFSAAVFYSQTKCTLLQDGQTSELKLPVGCLKQHQSYYVTHNQPFSRAACSQLGKFEPKVSRLTGMIGMASAIL